MKGGKVMSWENGEEKGTGEWDRVEEKWERVVRRGTGRDINE